MSEVEKFQINDYEEILEDRFLRCFRCNKVIDKNEPYIVAYKNGLPAYYCREHFDDAKTYLDFFQEFVEPNLKIEKEWKVDPETTARFYDLIKQLQPRAMVEPINPETEFALQVDDKFDKYWVQSEKYYMQRGGEPVWHEISQVKYDKAYDEYVKRRTYFEKLS